MVAVSHVEEVFIPRRSLFSPRWLMEAFLAPTSPGKNISIATHIRVLSIVPLVYGLVGRRAPTLAAEVLQADPEQSRLRPLMGVKTALAQSMRNSLAILSSAQSIACGESGANGVLAVNCVALASQSGVVM
jgi:hypothetical protein